MNEEKMVIEDEQRTAFSTFAISNLQGPVLSLVSNAAEKENLHNRRKYQIIRCFENWMLLNSSEEVKLQLHNVKVIDLCFDVLSTFDSCNQEASDALMSVMVVCKDVNVYGSLYQLILQNLIKGQSRN